MRSSLAGIGGGIQTGPGSASNSPIADKVSDEEDFVERSILTLNKLLKRTRIEVDGDEAHPPSLLWTTLVEYTYIVRELLAELRTSFGSVPDCSVENRTETTERKVGGERRKTSMYVHEPVIRGCCCVPCRSWESF